MGCSNLTEWGMHRTADPGDGPIRTLKKKRHTEIFRMPLDFFGSPGRTRTCDKAVNSRLLYQLSYRGSVVTPRRLLFAGSARSDSSLYTLKKKMSSGKM
jgi:hypothetical protein